MKIQLKEVVDIKLKKTFATPRIGIMLKRMKSLNMQKIARQNELMMSQEYTEIDLLAAEADEEIERLSEKLKRTKKPEKIKEITEEQETLIAYKAQLGLIKTMRITQDEKIVKYDEELEKLQLDESFYKPIISYAYEITDEQLESLSEHSEVNIINLLGFFLTTTIESSMKLENTSKQSVLN